MSGSIDAAGVAFSNGAEYLIRGFYIDRYILSIMVPVNIEGVEWSKIAAHVSEKAECLYLWNKEGFHEVVIHHWRRQDVAFQLTTSRLFDDKFLSHSQWPQYHIQMSSASDNTQAEKSWMSRLRNPKLSSLWHRRWHATGTHPIFTSA